MMKNFSFDFLKPSRSLKIQSCFLLDEGVTLFIPEGYDSQQTPSLAFQKPIPHENANPIFSDQENLLPQFFKKGATSIVTLVVPPGTSFYGTGEVTGPLLRNGKSIELWNTDNLKYEKAKGRRLYQAHPWALGVRDDGSAFGILFDTTWKASLKTNDEKIIFKHIGGPCRVVIIDRASPQAVLHGLAALIGTMPLPPKWTLGFHQSRYSYFPDAKVREIADEYRRRKLPCDGLWMDIHYMDGYRVFSFHPEHFPDARATNDYLHRHGFHSVWMIDPGVKVDPNDPVYQSGSRHRVWVTKKNGKEFHGKVWPGLCAFPDFTNPNVRSWWSKHYEDFISKGVDGVWNDMNEPAVFKTWSGTMPEDNQHSGGGPLPAGPHAMYHNVYGMLMTQATREGMLRAAPSERPFVLTRANYLGGQRYAATWTGDNAASFEFLKMSVPMSLNLGLSGQPCSGPDIGGFFGTITPELFGKWIAMAPFYPFARAHTDVSNPPREPWSFGPEIEKISRTALERRYRLLPYLYTLSYYAALQGDLIMQPLFFADPKDKNLRAEDRIFLLGADLLVIPAWAEEDAQKNKRPLNLPRGKWQTLFLLDEKITPVFKIAEANEMQGTNGAPRLSVSFILDDASTGATRQCAGSADVEGRLLEDDGYQATLKIRAGAIIPLGEKIQHSGEASSILTLLVNLDDQGKARGMLYEDAGNGFDYRNGEYLLTAYEAALRGDRLEIKKTVQGGTMASAYREMRVRLIGHEQEDGAWKKAFATTNRFHSGHNDISTNHDHYLSDEW